MAVLVKKAKKVKRKPHTAPGAAVRWNQPNKPDGPLSVAERNKVLEDWLAKYPRPISLVVHKYPKMVRLVTTGRGAVSDDEANQMCLLGAVKAARLFDPARGFKFWSYCLWHMRAELSRHLAKLVRRGVLLGGRAVRSLDDLAHPSDAGDDRSHAEMVADHRPDPSRLSQSRDVRQAIIDAVNKMVPGERDREIIRLRWGLNDEPPRTLQEVGQEFAVTRERIRQIEVRVLGRVKGELAELLGELDAV